MSCAGERVGGRASGQYLRSRSENDQNHSELSTWTWLTEDQSPRTASDFLLPDKTLDDVLESVFGGTGREFSFLDFFLGVEGGRVGFFLKITNENEPARNAIKYQY